MASAAEAVPQADVLPPVNTSVPSSPPRMDGQRPPAPRPSIHYELKAPPRDVDSISIDSTCSVPDFNGRRLATFEDERTTTAYEAWELVCIDDMLNSRSWKSFCGISFGTRWESQNDGCILANVAVSHDQGELADMHDDAIRAFKHKRGVSQDRAYEQDLANRANDLPCDVYDKLQQLLEDKTVATNKNPYRQREWRVVVLQPGEFRMTELLPQRKRKHLFTRKKKSPVSATWFVVLRGREVKSTKQDGGWRAYGRCSNPWWRLDKRETKDERGQHKDIVNRQKRAHDRHLPPYRPRPGRVGMPPPPPPPPPSHMMMH
ncbi:hypothetical protein F4802DRAFT_182081 [Xylaria palmicola]|nr:hypothetical protein F4802DRAFT_182081 [Xylaria palmicola]